MSKNTNLSFLTDYITADITNGRIGINNASPTVAFDVSGATRISGALTLTSTISNGTYTYTLPSATGILALTSALSGTTNYVPKFTASGTIGNSSLQDDGTNVSLSNGYYISTRTDNTSVLRTHLLMQRGSGAGTYADIFTAGDTTNGVASIHFGFNSSSKMVITAAGNVGIGTNSPSDKLTVIMNNNTNGTGIVIRALNDGGTASQPALSFVNGTGNNISQIVADNGTGYLAFNTGTANTERLRITSGGNLLVGTTTDSGSLITASSYSTSSKSKISENATTVAANTATTIFTKPAGNGGAFVLVTGRTAANNWFFDTVVFNSYNSASALSTNNGGSPPARSYSVSADSLQVTVPTALDNIYCFGLSAKY